MDVDDWPLTGDCGDTARSMTGWAWSYDGYLAAYERVFGVMAGMLGIDPALPFWGGTP